MQRVSVLDELRAASAENSNRPSCSGRDDQLAAHGLKGLYKVATRPSSACPYQLVKHAVDKRLYAGEAWSLLAIADWPDHEYEWQQVNPDQVKESLKLPFTSRSNSGSDLLTDGDRGMYISGTIDPYKPNQEPSGPVAEGSKAPVKIKIKMGGGSKRQREDEEVKLEGLKSKDKGAAEGKRPKIEQL